LEMLGADKAHEDGHKGQGIKIGIVDENFDAGTHGDVVQRVVKHAAPSASISTYNTYKDHSTTRESVKVENGVFAVTLPYNVTESTSFTMTFNNEDIQNETNLTVEGKANDLQVKSSSADFKNLKILDGRTLQGEVVEDETYQVIFEYTGMTSDSLAEEIQNAIEDQMDIINISLGALGHDSKLQTAIDAAVEAGIIVVAASGNDGKHTNETHIYYPAAHTDVVSVGAVGVDGNYIEISNYGEVKAPGIYFTSDTSYHWGTSIAAPYVSGLTAIYMNQQNSKDVKSYILNNTNEKGIVQYESLEKEEADKTALQTAIETAEKVVADKYTEDSFDSLTAALMTAQNVNEDEKATQAAVNNATTTLQTVIEGLVAVEEDPSKDEDPLEVEDSSKDESTSEVEDSSKDENPSEVEDSSKDEAPLKDGEPSAVEVEVGKTTPTPIQPKQTVKIGKTGSSIVLPADLPEGGSIVVTKVEETDNKVKDATNLKVAGDIYTIDLIDLDDFNGKFNLTLNYAKDAEGTPAIYYYNEDKEEWEKRGGTINEDMNTISLEVEHFSTYDVFVAVAEEEQEEESITENEQNEKPKEKGSGKDPGELKAVTPDLNYNNKVTITPIAENDTEETNKEDKDKTVVLVDIGSEDKENKELPSTATSNYNFITVGLLLIFLDEFTAIIFRRKTV